jgi:hypothetical protein
MEPHLPAGDEGFDAAGEGEVGVEEEGLDATGCPPLEGQRQLDDVSGDAAIAVVGALRALEVEEDGRLSQAWP